MVQGYSVQEVVGAMKPVHYEQSSENSKVT